MPCTVAAAVRRLLSGHDVTLGDLPGLPVQDQLVLVRRLLLEGVVVASSMREHD